MTIETSEWKNLPEGVSLPKGERIFVVGDIHGHSENLMELLDDVAFQDTGRLIFLGDYIDRGPNSLDVLDIIAHVKLQFEIGEIDVDPIYLTGNHEQMFMAGMTGNINALSCWYGNGGKEVCKEMGYTNDDDAFYDLIHDRQKFRRLFGVNRIRFLFDNLQTYHKSGNILCVHGGLNPHMNLDDQLNQNWMDMPVRDEAVSPMWVRGPFLNHNKGLIHDLFVIHGHTVELDGPVFTNHRLGIDVGSFVNAKVCMLEVVGNKWRSHISTIAP